LRGIPALDHDIESTVNGFVQARQAARALAAFPGMVPPDLATAYRCQNAALQRWPDDVAGWKVARIPPPWAAQYTEERLIGPVLRRNVHRPAMGAVVECPVFAGGFSAVEAEIGICVRDDAAADRTDWNASSVIELVGSMHIGVEVASSPLATLNDLGSGAVVADFGNNWGVIIGAEVSNWQTHVAAIQVATWIDEKFVGRGRVALQAAPLEALAFAANKAASLGRPLRAGAYISTGMITGVHDILVGQAARLAFEGCGELRCRMIAAGPLAAMQPA
jgi:2-keto-4-pentenoate hydratase